VLADLQPGQVGDGRRVVVDRGGTALLHMADDLLAVVLEVQPAGVDRGDRGVEVDDVDPDGVGGERAVRHLHTPRVHAVTDLDLVERRGVQLPDAGAVGDINPVEGPVGAGDLEHGAADRGDPAFGEVRVAGARVEVDARRGERGLGSEGTERGRTGDGGAAEYRGGEEPTAVGTWSWRGLLSAVDSGGGEPAVEAGDRAERRRGQVDETVRPAGRPAARTLAAERVGVGAAVGDRHAHAGAVALVGDVEDVAALSAGEALPALVGPGDVEATPPRGPAVALSVPFHRSVASPGQKPT
jgi:hypothetical protein